MTIWSVLDADRRDGGGFFRSEPLVLENEKNGKVHSKPKDDAQRGMGRT
jgi:hypothetical protein